MYIDICVCVCACTHQIYVCIYAHAYTCTHTHKQTNDSRSKATPGSLNSDSSRPSLCSERTIYFPFSVSTTISGGKYALENLAAALAPDLPRRRAASRSISFQRSPRRTAFRGFTSQWMIRLLCMYRRASPSCLPMCLTCLHVCICLCMDGCACACGCMYVYMHMTVHVQQRFP